MTRIDSLRERELTARERSWTNHNERMPLVIEPPTGGGLDVQLEAIRANSDALKERLARHGALLLRGFALDTEIAFERAVSSLTWTRPMSGFFMSELGRDRVPGTDAVFYTNSRVRTGGGFYLGGVHSENYFTTDVPQLQAFWCKRASRYGGETGLVDGTALAAALSEQGRERLAEQTVLVSVWRAAEVASRYSLPERVVIELCTQAGLRVELIDAEVLLLLHKPSLWDQPGGERSLQVNLSVALKFDAEVRERFRSRYVGLRWMLHRASWRHEFIARALGDAPSVPTPPARTSRPASFGKRLRDLLDTDDVQALAQAVADQCAAFDWRCGDLVLLDNRQVLHMGLPGSGPRELRVMMCDVLTGPWSAGSGVCPIEPPRPQRSLHERLIASAQSAP